MTIYRPDGSVMRTMNYVDGLLHGEATDHDERGSVRTRTTLKAGRRDGPMTEYDGDGNAITRTTFSGDRQVGEKQQMKINLPNRRLWWQGVSGRSR
jgi:antitoxin component YwqK of YwqJK toxin-antitoxin module